MTEKIIHKICKLCNIKDYTINNDKSIDVDNDVILHAMNLDIIPLNFNKVNGIFDCSLNNLKSLKGAPNQANGDFYCANNNLESLKYAPEHISGTFHCNDNGLTSLKYSPKIIEGNFYFINNEIATFEYFPKVKKNIITLNNPIELLWELFKDKNYIEYFNELDIIQENGTAVILDRLNYFLIDIGKKEVNTKIFYYKII